MSHLTSSAPRPPAAGRGQNTAQHSPARSEEVGGEGSEKRPPARLFPTDIGDSPRFSDFAPPRTDSLISPPRTLHRYFSDEEAIRPRKRSSEPRRMGQDTVKHSHHGTALARPKRGGRGGKARERGRPPVAENTLHRRAPYTGISLTGRQSARAKEMQNAAEWDKTRQSTAPRRMGGEAKRSKRPRASAPDRPQQGGVGGAALKRERPTDCFRPTSALLRDFQIPPRRAPAAPHLSAAPTKVILSTNSSPCRKSTKHRAP